MEESRSRNPRELCHANYILNVHDWIYCKYSLLIQIKTLIYVLFQNQILLVWQNVLLTLIIPLTYGSRNLAYLRLRLGMLEKTSLYGLFPYCNFKNSGSAVELIQDIPLNLHSTFFLQELLSIL